MPDWNSTKTWSEDEDILASDLNDVSENLDHLHDWTGEIGDPAVITADSATFTAETTIITLSPTIPVGGRDIELRANIGLRSSVAGDVVTLKIKEGATVKREFDVRIGAANTTEDVEFSVRIAAPASGAHTYTLTATRASGTGNITAKASATREGSLRAIGL